MNQTHSGTLIADRTTLVLGALMVAALVVVTAIAIGAREGGSSGAEVNVQQTPATRDDFNQNPRQNPALTAVVEMSVPVGAVDEANQNPRQNDAYRGFIEGLASVSDSDEAGPRPGPNGSAEPAAGD